MKTVEQREPTLHGYKTDATRQLKTVEIQRNCHGETEKDLRAIGKNRTVCAVRMITMTVDACMALETKATVIQGLHEVRMPTEQDGGLVSEVWRGKLKINDGDSSSILLSTVPGGLLRIN